MLRYPKYNRHKIDKITEKRDMVKVLFVCLGNICRSPMAEFVCKDMALKRGMADRMQIASAGTSAEEAGNPVFRGARAELSEHGISCEGKRARKLTFDDYWEYDYILCAESRNIHSAIRIFGGDPQGKVMRLLDFSKAPRDIADPWYTGDFYTTYGDIAKGCSSFLDYLQMHNKI